MKNVRIWFEKKGAARYISHLDLTRNMARGLKLSGLPVWYTEGFNPRIYMTYAMPLSLGVCGERECMDIRLTEDVPLEDIAPRLNAHLPAGLQALEATEPVDKFEDIQYGEYQLFLEGDPAALEEQLHTQFQRECWCSSTPKRATRSSTSSRISKTPSSIPRRTACCWSCGCRAASTAAPIPPCSRRPSSGTWAWSPMVPSPASACFSRIFPRCGKIILAFCPALC